jgi:hypothetical protein
VLKRPRRYMDLSNFKNLIPSTASSDNIVARDVSCLSTRNLFTYFCITLP